MKHTPLPRIKRKKMCVTEKVLKVIKTVNDYLENIPAAAATATATARATARARARATAKARARAM